MQSRHQPTVSGKHDNNIIIMLLPCFHFPSLKGVGVLALLFVTDCSL